MAGDRLTPAEYEERFAQPDPSEAQLADLAEKSPEEVRANFWAGVQFGFDRLMDAVMRAAITAAIADIRGRHVKVDVTETEVRDWENYNYRFIADRPRPECLICQERWPCPDALLADRLEEVTK